MLDVQMLNKMNLLEPIKGMDGFGESGDFQN